MRILIADDNDVVRCAMRGLLEAQPEWEVCGEAIDGPDAIQKARQLRPDVILIDVSMPGASGLEAARSIRGELPESQILLVAEHEASVMKQMVELAGASGFVLKSRAVHDLVPAVSGAASRSVS